LKAHQKHPTGFETIKTYLDRDYRPAKDFQSYVYLTQLLQTDGMTRAIIAHRRAKPYCMGTLFWQFNDTWPGISWSCRDYYSRKKMLQYALPYVYSTLLISTRENGNKVEVYVTSDSLDAYPARMELRILDARGNVRWSEIVPAIIKPNTTSFICSRDKFKLVLPSDTVNAFLNIRILQDDKVICERNHFFCSPKNMKLMRPALSIRLVIADDGAKQIELKSSTFVKSMELSWNGDPSVFDRNYCDMNGNEKYLFRINSPDFKESNLNEIKYRSLIDTYSP
jgi:beta-mannosidase